MNRVHKTEVKVQKPEAKVKGTEAKRERVLFAAQAIIGEKGLRALKVA